MVDRFVSGRGRVTGRQTARYNNGHRAVRLETILISHDNDSNSYLASAYMQVISLS